MMTTLISVLTIPATVEHVPEARHWVRQSLVGHPAGRDAETCVTELVTNSVLYARGERVSVGLIDTGHGIRGEIRDGGGASIPAVPDKAGGLEDINGRGLLIVEHLADAWGTEPDGAGRLTYFEIHTPGDGR